MNKLEKDYNKARDFLNSLPKKKQSYQGQLKYINTLKDRLKDNQIRLKNDKDITDSAKKFVERIIKHYKEEIPKLEKELSLIENKGGLK